MAASVLITGASSGIGAALAKAYAARGAHLALLARREEPLAELAQSLAGAHSVHAVDVTDHDAMQRAAAAEIASHGCPDIVIANAGISLGTLTEHPEDHAAFKRVVDTNLLASFSTFAPFVAAMKARGSGTLVGIASMAGIRGLPGAEAYSASKAAMISYCESLRVELRGTGVRVVTIAPGYIATPMTASNRYPMPFLMNADRFAARALAAIDRGASFTVIPWQMGVTARVMRVLPNWLYDALFSGAPRKARPAADGSDKRSR